MNHRLTRTLAAMAALATITCVATVALAVFPPCAIACDSKITLSGCLGCCNVDTTCDANEILKCQDACDGKFPMA